MLLTFDLANRFESAFGFVPAGSPLAASKQEKSDSVVLYGGSDVAFADIELYRVGADGKQQDHPYFTLGNHNSKITNPDIIYDQFISTPIISIRRSKNLIISTPDRSDGEVVENFSKKSYDITINGIIVDMLHHQYPQNQVQRLREIFDVDDGFKAVCTFLNDLGINSIYFTDVLINGTAGYADTLSYSLSARSLQAPDFQIINTKEHI